MKKYKIRYFCCTHTGKCRSLNQDNFICNGICRDAVNDTLKYPISGIVSASLLAQIMNSKYVLALPLYRQEQELRRLGLPVSR